MSLVPVPRINNFCVGMGWLLFQLRSSLHSCNPCALIHTNKQPLTHYPYDAQISIIISRGLSNNMVVVEDEFRYITPIPC